MENLYPQLALKFGRLSIATVVNCTSIEFLPLKPSRALSAELAMAVNNPKLHASPKEMD
jgi:hypothetical protein